jgi:hypothetical protein
MRWAVGVIVSFLGAGAASAATVEFTGIYSKAALGGGGTWAVYARISNPTSINPQPGRTNVVGFSSLGVDVTILGGTGQSITGAQNMMPFGTSSMNDPDGNLGQLKYGFWVFRSNGTLTPTGVTGINAAQYLQWDTSGPEALVLQGVGRSAGGVAVGGVFTSATAWDFPVLVARGTFAGPEFGPGAGFKIAPSNAQLNLIQDVDSGPGEAVGHAVEAPTAITFVAADGGGASDLLTLGRHGDSNFDGTVNLTDLQRMEGAYAQSGRTWYDGDFNLDGTTNGADLNLLALQYDVAPPAPGTFASATFDAAVQEAFASVPEPGAVGMVVAALCAIWSRHRRR